RTFNVVDDFNREALSIEIDLNLPAQRVVRVLDRIAANRGYPVMLRMDNGPEFISLALAEWAEQHAVKLEFIQPGKPTQNAFIERFNRTYRTEILDFYLFRTLSEVREITEKWLSEYNCERPQNGSISVLRPSVELTAKSGHCYYFGLLIRDRW
ncbi:integrase core domain-containing protein, partial [Escherichia coli]|uniref:integrase core domain-containing protein n=1 Tax=Escherichia coli TaxID=562 RepID=UPI001F42002F